MKRLGISITVLAIVFIYSLSTLFIIKNYNIKLSTAVVNVQTLFENEQYEEAVDASEELMQVWEKYETVMLIMVRDDKLSDLNQSIAKIHSFAKKQNDELEAETQSVIFQLDHIYETEYPHWYNFL